MQRLYSNPNFFYSAEIIHSFYVNCREVKIIIQTDDILFIFLILFIPYFYIKQIPNHLY